MYFFDWVYKIKLPFGLAGIARKNVIGGLKTKSKSMEIK
jgi:hypothetical protein